RGKAVTRRDKVLMLDARSVYRKVSRKINDFSPEHLHNLSAIVWLYRGLRGRFLGLVRDYFARICTESSAIQPALKSFEAPLDDLCSRFETLSEVVEKDNDIDVERREAVNDSVAELREAAALYKKDAGRLCESLSTFVAKYATGMATDNKAQHAARKVFEPI